MVAMTWRQTEQEDMIKKIVIRDVASYDHEGCTFDDLAKVNIIYGGNGTGKTTISRVLGETLLEEAYPHCEVEWDGDREHVLVYNKDFRDSSGWASTRRWMSTGRNARKY